MARQVLLFLLIAFLNVSVILCREDHQQHISDSFSHHHRRSTPEDSVVSTKDPLSVTEGDGKPLGEIQHGTYVYNKQTYHTVDPTAQIVSICISIVLMVIGLIIIFCFGKKIGRRVRTGYIVNTTAVNSGGVQPPPYPTPYK